ncbi:MAG: isopentenyl-diphosphate Delta-isomerase [Gammaproteobacteria bacterium]|nr:isopentenyl-diphosphate Delta-isomerase [Gammaproteobacteria bacterium]MDH3362762.1 isopentenyl-diphosphate Delta-isomerase [Gammaproteobacteria bacterium]MDH3482160.1 isopentenyl-diphosphate Delta-isomerase [Gammaproteobacteria bacterium]
MNDNHRIVSSESEELILVDSDDNEIGYLSKAGCHDGGGVLHRAFSLFLFNDAGELLLQRRSDSKRLWPGYWSNSCCSHPRRGESMETATKRRLSDELNIETDLDHVYSFCYTAKFDAAGSENELCHVYLGRITGDVQPNDSEIAGIRFISGDALGEELSRCPEQFTPWFKQEWQELVGNHRDQLAHYCTPVGTE